MASKITRNQLKKSGDFFRDIYNCKGRGSENKIKCILESAPVYKLRSLVRLFFSVLRKFIPCKNRLHKKKIKEFANSLRPLLDQCSNYLREKKPKLLQFFCAILPIVRFFVVPLFEFDLPEGPEVDLGGGIEDIPIEDEDSYINTLDEDQEGIDDEEEEEESNSRTQADLRKRHYLDTAHQCQYSPTAQEDNSAAEEEEEGEEVRERVIQGRRGQFIR